MNLGGLTMSYEYLIGKMNEANIVVSDNNTAFALGSGSLKVLATPEMIRLMEEAAAELIEKNLPHEETSVGIFINVKHMSPTPIGMNVRAEVKIVSVEGRKIIFEVAAFDEHGEIGVGTHERFVVNRKNFQSKADAK